MSLGYTWIGPKTYKRIQYKTEQLASSTAIMVG
jgi:hypothetical protein